jgi:DNA-binding MarR family transcriptional regulator
MNNSICFHSSLRKTARAMTVLYDGALSPAGLTVAQFQLLWIICRMDAPTLSGVAEATGSERSASGRNVRVLERSGLVSLEPSMDKCAYTIEVSDEGRRRMEIAVPLWEAVQKRVDTRLDDKTRAQALELLGIFKQVA